MTAARRSPKQMLAGLWNLVQPEGIKSMTTNTPVRLAINVGITSDDRNRSCPNKKNLSESYATETLTRGYRAYLRHDGCEGRRFQHFMERGSNAEIAKPENRPNSVKRLRKLERRGMLFGAALDIVPSLFHSCWMLFSNKR